MQKDESLVKQWRDFAFADLEAAKIIYEKNGSLFIVVFHCQQSCEKIIKATLIKNEISFKKTHDLYSLIVLIENFSFFTSRLYDVIEIFEKFGVEIRYPDPEIIITDSEVKEAIKNAEYLVEYFNKHLNEE